MSSRGFPVVQQPVPAQEVLHAGAGVGAVTAAGSGACDRELAEAEGAVLGDADQLVVLGQPLGVAHRADLDLPGGGADREVGEEVVLGLAGTRGHDGSVSGGAGLRDDVESAGEGAVLVDLDQHAVGGAAGDALGQPLRGWW